MTPLQTIREAVVKADSLNLVTGKRHHNFKHGQTGSRLYKKWEGMKKRCLNKNDSSYARYGGSGVSVSKSWLDFRNFARDMGKTYIVGLSLERIDNSKGYSKENCKWIPLSEQGRNKRNVRLFEYKGQTLTIREWADKYGLSYFVLHSRLTKYKWPIDVALNARPDMANKYKLHQALPNGKVKSFDKKFLAEIFK